MNSGIILVGLLLTLSGSAQAGPRRMILFGGGERPKAALSRFCEWAGKDQARILAVTWAADVPQEYFEEIRGQLAPFSPASVEHSPSTAAVAARKEEFLARLAQATGVFFSGGDQNRIALVLRENPDLREALRRRYREGAVFAAASAGAAAMSERMITGEGDFTVIDGAKVATDQGLGLLPDAIVDQHFIVRQRQNRLFGLILQHPALTGLGLDKDAALSIEDERAAVAFGPGLTLLVRAPKAEQLTINVLKDGVKLDLRRR